MRVLILADDCNPDWPSLPVVGYQMARSIAEHADVVVATHVRNRANIERAGLGRADVIYVNNEYIAAPLYKLGRWVRGGGATGWTTAIAFSYPSYLAFEWEVWRKTRDQLRRGAFDVVHRVTPMSPTLPSPMAKWSPVPFVLGPLNGGLPWPKQFRDELRQEREWLSYLRQMHRHLPYLRATYENAAAVLAAFSHTIDSLPTGLRSAPIAMPEVGYDPEIFYPASQSTPRDRRTVLFVGRLVPYKQPQALVHAFVAEPSLRSHRLVIVGDGPERPALEALIRQHSLAGCVELIGWKTQREVAELMRNAAIFAFPSIRELGAGVVVEAMACGLACVVVDHGGPGALVDSSRGIKLPLTNRDQLAFSFGKALARLVADPVATASLGAAAREYVAREYSWDAKARQVVSIYRRLVRAARSL